MLLQAVPYHSTLGQYITSAQSSQCSIIALSGSRVCYSVGLNIVITASKKPLLVVFIKAVSADISVMPLVEILEGQIDNSGVSKGVNIR